MLSSRHHQYELLGQDVENYTGTRKRIPKRRTCFSPTNWLLPRTFKRKHSRIRRAGYYLLISLGLIVLLTPIFNPSYSRRPNHYSGSNPRQERVFIAANIVNADLIRGGWGNAVSKLIDIIGPQNVFISIYENDSGSETKKALQEFGNKLTCAHAIVSGHLDMKDFPTVHLLPDESRVKRITYLSTVRNHALDPLTSPNAVNSTLGKAAIENPNFDRLLFINDVVFDPKDAADLIFSTNYSPEKKRADYHAACAMDYVNPVKFYDRLALRDNDAWESGVPIFPWFVRSGSKETWNGVMAGSDAVPVQSCWGGMVSFDAKWFQKERIRSDLQPLTFRSEPDIFWDASECCLIHADLQELVKQSGEKAQIYVNPFIRVAYDTGTLRWLEFTRRFERLFIIPHIILQWVLRQPWGGPRRLETVGETLTRSEWFYTGAIDPVPEHPTLNDVGKFGSWQTVQRVVKPGGYCGYDFLLALKKKRVAGEKVWEKILAPHLER